MPNPQLHLIRKTHSPFFSLRFSILARYELQTSHALLSQRITSGRQAPAELHASLRCYPWPLWCTLQPLKFSALETEIFFPLHLPRLYTYHREAPHHLPSRPPSKTLSTMMHLQPLYPRSPPTPPSVTLIPGTRNKSCNISAHCHRAVLNTPFNHSTWGNVEEKEVLVLTDKALGNQAVMLNTQGCPFKGVFSAHG